MGKGTSGEAGFARDLGDSSSQRCQQGSFSARGSCEHEDARDDGAGTGRTTSSGVVAGGWEKVCEDISEVK